ncbi:hypothetical protein P3547_14310 [Vibrio parahaemolyticus]|nr:hypothetical protein [Vibrio parahaemolyticus]
MMTTEQVSASTQRLINAFPHGTVPSLDDTNPIYELLEKTFYEARVIGSSEGCYMPMPFPTGVGKTHNTLSLIIKATLDDIEQELTLSEDYEPRIIYYITNSVDNVLDAYNSLVTRIKECNFLDEIQKTAVIERLLYAPSNSRSLLDMMEFHNDALDKIFTLFDVEKNAALINSIDLLRSEQSVLKVNLSPAQKATLTERINNTANDCYSALIRHIQKIQLGDNPVSLTERNVALLSMLIPGVKLETGVTRVVFMTTKKFLFGLQQSKGKFHPSSHLCNSMLLIDEVDRQHQEMLTHLVSSNDTDLLATLRTIHSNLKEQKLCAKPQYDGIEKMFEKYLDKVKEFFEKWSLQYSFDVHPSVIKENKEILLFSDTMTTHITSVKGRLAFSFNNAHQQHEISHYGQFEDRTENDFPKFLGGLERLVNRTFHSLVRRAEERYRENRSRNMSEYELRQLTSSQAIASILDQLNLHSLRQQLNQQLNYLVGRKYSPRRSAANYHTRGIRMIEVDRLPEAQDSVMFKHHGYSMSPTGMLAAWVESGCCILGVSATAECPSVIHNFDIKYLERSLGSNFIRLSRSERSAIRTYYESERNYSGRGVEIVPGHVEHDYVFIRDLLGQWNPKAKNRELLYCSLFQCTEQQIDFNLSWLSKLCKAMQRFAQCSNNRYMLGMLNRGIKGGLSKFLTWYGNNLSESIGSPIKVVTGINAHFLKQGRFDKEVISHLESQPGKVIAITAYQTMSSGKNPDYKFDPRFENDSLRHVGHRSHERTDIDFMYLEEPTNLISVEGKPETRTSDRLLLLSYGMALQQAGLLPPNSGNVWAHKVVTHSSPFNLCRELKGQFYQKDSTDSINAIFRVIEQAVGRAARTEMKRESVYIVADSLLVQLLSKDERDISLFSHEYRELVAYAKQQFGMLNAPVDREAKRRQNLAILHTGRSLGAIERMLYRINEQQKSDHIEAWQSLRCKVLKVPASVEAPTYEEYYVQSPEDCGYSYTPALNERHSDDYRFFELAVAPIKRVSELRSLLPIFMRNEIAKAHFESKGFATQWAPNARYVLTPPMFINIYLGALGEEVGKAIFKHYGFSFESLPVEHFEVFDEIIVREENKALIDFKHWDLASVRSLPDEERRKTMSDLSKKLSALELNKLVVCNMLKQGDEPVSYYDSDFNSLPSHVGSSIIAIPSLINKHDGSVDMDSITALSRWLDI